MGCSFCRAPKPITPEQRLRIDAILDFWYTPGQDRNVFYPASMKLWFGASPEADLDIKNKFMGDYENYVSGEYTGWPLDKDGRLAAVLLCDQFSRQLFRKQAKAFDTDK